MTSLCDSVGEYVSDVEVVTLQESVGEYESDVEVVTLQDSVGESDGELDVVTLHEGVVECDCELDVVTVFVSIDVADADADISAVGVTPADPDIEFVRVHGNDMQVGSSVIVGEIVRDCVMSAACVSSALREALIDADAEFDADGLRNGDNDKDTLGVVDREIEPDVVCEFVRRAVVEIVVDRVSVVDRLLVGEIVLVVEAVRQLVARPDTECDTLLDPEYETVADGDADAETDTVGEPESVPIATSPYPPPADAETDGEIDGEREDDTHAVPVCDTEIVLVLVAENLVEDDGQDVVVTLTDGVVELDVDIDRVTDGVLDREPVIVPDVDIEPLWVFEPDTVEVTEGTRVADLVYVVVTVTDKDAVDDAVAEMEDVFDRVAVLDNDAEVVIDNVCAAVLE